jgi:hypothetical protein
MNKKTKPELTQAQLKEILDYNPETGIFTWLNVAVNRRVKNGDIAGYQRKDGYKEIVIRGKQYLSHILAYFYITGNFPIDMIDHINNIKNDNRWINLRDADNSKNKSNSKIYKNSSTGIKGVYKITNRWRAIVTCKNKRHDLGYFDTAQEASVAYEQKAKELHKEFYYKNNI